MLLNLFYVKCSIHLVPDVVKLIQYDYYLLYMKNDVMTILQEYFKFIQEGDKIYIKEYKISYENVRIHVRYFNNEHSKDVNPIFIWYKSDSEQYITLSYKKIKIKNEYQYGLMIKMSRQTTYSDLPSFKRIESRIMENTIYKKIKSRYNRIYLV